MAGDVARIGDAIVHVASTAGTRRQTLSIEADDAELRFLAVDEPGSSTAGDARRMVTRASDGGCLQENRMVFGTDTETRDKQRVIVAFPDSETGEGRERMTAIRGRR